MYILKNIYTYLYGTCICSACVCKNERNETHILSGLKKCRKSLLAVIIARG